MNELTQRQIDNAAESGNRVPYVGPRAFRLGEELYGRHDAAAELLDALIAERVVVCHSPSGAGKTSLIQALLIPKLTESGFTVLGPTRVGSMLTPEFQKAGANRYVASAILGMEHEHAAPIPLAEIYDMSLADYLKRRAPTGDPIVLIFDQFEEVLTLDPNDESDKAEFFRQLGIVLRPRNRWALFAIREEYVGALDPYAHSVPTRFASRYPLCLLDAAGAWEAIEMPAKKAGVPFTKDALERLVTNLRTVPQPNRPEGILGRYVEPVQLQVVCTRLWQGLPPDTKEVGSDLVGDVHTVEKALADYYADTVQRVASEQDINERLIRRWFDKALISGSVRTQVAQGGEAKWGLTEKAVEELVSAYLVRREDRRDTMWYELAHDRLIIPVKQDNARWFYERAGYVQRQAEAWEASGRPKGTLIRGKALKDALRWQTQPTAEITDEIEDFLTASVLNQQTGNRWAVGLLTIALILTAVTAVVMWRQVNDLKNQAALLRTVGRSLGLDARGELRDTTVLAHSLAADSALQESRGRGDTVQRNVAIWYFPKEGDPNIPGVLRDLGVQWKSLQSQNRVLTNMMYYGDSVSAVTLRVMALALIRAGVPLKAICPLANQTGRRSIIQVLGNTDRVQAANVPLETIAALSDTSKQLACTGTASRARAVVYIQFYGGADEVRDRQQAENLRRQLASAGFDAPAVDSVRARRNEVRYFHAEDKVLADSVARLTSRTLSNLPYIPSVPRSDQAPSGQIEVWLDLSRPTDP